MDDYAFYGHSLFETLLARAGRFRFLDFHWYRLQSAAPALQLTPPDWQTFLNHLETVPLDQDYVVRLTLLRQGGRWSDKPQRTAIDVRWRPCSPLRISTQRLLLESQLLPEKDPLRRFKSGNRLLYQHRLTHAQNLGYDDMLLVDRNNRVLETTLSNVYVLLNGEWVTPPLTDSLLPGTVRGYLIQQKYCREYPIRQRDIFQASALAVTNAVQGVVPVEAIQVENGSSRLFTVALVMQLTNQIQNTPYRSLTEWRQAKLEAHFRPWPPPNLY